MLNFIIIFKIKKGIVILFSASVLRIVLRRFCELKAEGF